MKFIVISCLAAALLTSSLVFAGAYDELTPAQQAIVQKGEQVFVTVDAPNAPWPKATIYQRIDATPEEVAAVFSDYELQKTYVPNLLKSSISKRVNASTTEIDYTLKVPVLKDENYTVRDTISSYDNGSSYQVAWTMVRASSTKSIDGFAKFEPLGTGTMMVYYNFVVPGSALAGIAKDSAMKQVRETGYALVKQVKLERTSQQALLQKQIEALRAALR